MTRNRSRRVGAAAILSALLVAATACSGSEGGSSGGSTTTVGATTVTTDGRLGDLSDLEGATRGLSGGELDCYDLQLAFVALTTFPLAVATGTEQAEIDKMQADLRVLRAQVPTDIVSDFDTYAEGVQAYADALKGIDLAAISDPQTQQQIAEASKALESQTMTAAADSIEQYFATTCPAPPPTTAAS